MDHGGQRRQRGGGQAAGPAATPELAAPSAAAGPREIPTCSALFPSVFPVRKPPPATGSSSARLLRCVQRPASQRLDGSRAAGACLPALPAVRRHNHYAGQAQPSHSAQPVGARRPRLQPAPAPPAHCRSRMQRMPVQHDLASGDRGSSCAITARRSGGGHQPVPGVTTGGYSAMRVDGLTVSDQAQG